MNLLQRIRRTLATLLIALTCTLPGGVQVLAAGITIPANCTIDVAGCSLVVSGDVTNAGTLRTSTGPISLSGNWLNSGSFVPGTGTVTFNATSGTQTLNTGGLAHAFYNVTHNAAGTVQMITNPIDINNTFTNTAGNFDANGLNMNVAKDWTNSATFTPGTGTVTLDGSGQTITGTTTFYRLTKITTALDTLTFSAEGADETHVTRFLTLQGALSNLMSLEKSGTNLQAKLNLHPGGAQSLGYLNVNDNNASGLTLVAGATSTDGGNTTNWNFGASTITWDGSDSADWDDPFNWNLGLVPGPGDTAIIAPLSGTVLFQPTLSTNVVLGNLTIQAGAVMTLNGKNLTVSTNFVNNGNLRLNGTETLNLTQDITNPGTFTYMGTNTGATITIRDFGATDYYHLVINDANATKDTFITNNNLATVGNLNVTAGTMNISTNSNALTVGGTLTVDGGTLTATLGTIDANGVAISAGVFTAPSSTTNTGFTVSGDFAHSGGTFTANNGKVTLDGASQAISGSTTFYQLRKVVAAAATLTLGAGDTQTVTGDLTLSGASGQLLSLVSSSSPTHANLNLQPGGTQAITHVNVKDNNAGGLELVARSSWIDSGHNNNWRFGGTTITWDGTTSIDWDVQSNWDKGLVPNQDDTAIIDPLSGTVLFQPTLSTNVQLTVLTTNAGATVSLAGKNMAVSGALTNNGTLTRYGNETVTFGTMDTAHGTFIYTGNGDAVQDTFTVTDYGDPDYFNLTFNDTNADPTKRDIFQTNAASTVNGALTVSGGTLDTSANANALVINGAVTVSGGTLTATGGTIDANSSVTVSSGTLTAPSSTANTGFTIAGNFAHPGGTFTHSNGKVTFDGTNQFITGNTTFYQFRKVAAATDILTFGAGETQTVVSNLTINGAAAAQLLSLRSNSSPTAAKLSLLPGGTQNIILVDVKDNDASGGLTLVARTAWLDSGNNTHWRFGPAIMVWTGTTSTDWTVDTNWDLGLAPNQDDTAVIADTSSTTNRQPVLTGATTVTNLTLQAANTTLNSNANNLTVTDTLSNLGTITLVGTETVEIKVIDPDSGTFVYTGTGAAGTFASKITDPSTHAVLASEYFNLTINDASNTGTFQRTENLVVLGALTITGGNLDTSTSSKNLTVGGNTSISAGTLTAANSNIDANGAVSITGTGALIAPTTAKSFTIAGDFTHAAGSTFTNSSGRVTLDTTATALITGDTTFYDLFVTTPGKHINFAAGSNQTVTNILNLVGARGNDIVLGSGTPGTSWNITFPNSTQLVSSINVQDSNALTNIISCLNCTDSGNNNSNWVFAQLQLTAPADQRIIGQVPVIIGQGIPNLNVLIKGLDETGTEVLVATALADANGNYRVVLGVDADTDGTTSVTAGVKLRLSSGTVFDNYLVVSIINPSSGDEVPGLTNTLMVIPSPTADQVPQIASPVNGQRVHGSKPTFTGTGLANQTVTVVANDKAGNLLLSTVGTATVDASGHYSVTLSTALPANVNYASVVVNGVSSELIAITLTDPFGYVFDATTDRLIKNATVTLYRAADNQIAENSICDSSGNITTVKDIACEDTNPFITGEDGLYHFLAASGNYYLTVTAVGYDYPSHLTTFPVTRTVDTGSKGEHFTVGTTVVHLDQPLDATGFLLRIEKDANKKEVRVGDVVTYTIVIKNLSTDNAVNNVLIDDKIPAGFKYLANRVLLDGVPISDPTGNRPLVFDLGTIAAANTVTLRYQLVVGSGVVPGTYENSAHARYANLERISNYATKAVKVVIDPLFDLGSVIGKVFYDYNENGRQDGPEYDATEGTTIVEKPVPNVQIVMEDGTIVTTDPEGKYSLPGLMPGRHILRVDERTLPPGTFLTTDKAVIIDVTQGSMVKANFGINADNTQIVGKDAQFFNEKIALTQDRNQPAPRLNAALFTPSPAVTAPAVTAGPAADPTAPAAAAAAPGAEQLAMYNGMLLRQAEFRIFTNYSPFIEGWRLDIIDADTKKLVKRFEGNRFNIHDPVFWNGRGDDDKIIHTDRKYTYVLSVTDTKNHRDLTHEKILSVRLIDTEEQYKKEKEKEIDTDVMKARVGEYRQWVDTQSAVNNIHRQNIPIAGETVKISRQGQQIRSVRLLKEGALFAEVPVEQYYGLTPQELLASGMSAQERPDNIEVIVPNGDYTLDVVGAAAGQGPSVPPGPPAPAPLAPLPPGSAGLSGLDHYSRPLKVGDDYMMFVAMGDGKAGYTFNRGNIEAVAPDDKYKNGFWSEGKAAYYLKGKIKGKYLVTSSFDTERKQKELFRQLDPETYYPIYGDKSSVNYDATNTQGPLYLLVQWDKSSAIWGNYAIDFNDTEFSAFSRSYYGGKLDYQSVNTNPYGDARTKLVVFHAEVQQLPDHNEFLGTGGSLYFLKNRGVIMGSDKIRIEVRDKITGLVISSKDMKNGADYELDEKEGRILFWQPVSMIAKSESIVATETLLDGNPVYVVADYEYDPKDKITHSSRGGRVAQGVGENVVIGGTYINETQADSNNYTLQGTDVTARLGPDATVKAEFAQTESVGSSTYVSTDGGISFTGLQSGSVGQGQAYGLSGDARLFNRLGMQAYYKWVGDSFSSAATSYQQGKEMAGLKLTFDLTPETRLTASEDIQKLINSGNLQTQAQVGASETSTTLMQIVHESERLKLTGAYQINQVTERIGDIITSTNQVSRTLAGQAAYALNGRVTLKMGQQFDVLNADNNISTLGVQVRVFNNLMAEVTEAFSRDATATTAGLTYNVSDRLAVSTAYTLAMGKGGQVDRTASLGAQQKISDKITSTGTVAVTQSTTGVQTTTASLATTAKLTENSALEGVVGRSTGTDGSAKNTASLAADAQLGKDTALKTTVALNGDDTGTSTKTVSLETGRKIGDDAAVHGTVAVNDDGTTRSKTMGFDVTQKVDEKTDRGSNVQVTEDSAGNKTSTVGFTNKTQISKELQAVGEQSFGTNSDGFVNANKYGLVRDANGRKLEGTLTRQNGQSATTGLSQSNIFGLSGDVNDKLALQGSLEKGAIQNLDGTHTNRIAIAGGAGYVWKDPETAMERLKDSLKVELRMDTGAHAAQQFVFFNSIEGRVTDNLSVTAKLDYAKTWSTESNQVQARHREIILGAAYRPVNFDNLNLIARYTARENQGPSGQLSAAATDVEQSRSQVLAAEAIYDFNENWQLAEKLAFRINDEKITGFEFNRTHTWLMIHRINYRVDRNWTLSGEYRKLTQVEAKDSKSGFLMEATRNINDNTQLGLGWNFTKFSDDMTNLSFTAQGPFVRMTGKLYDRTPEERARARAKWLDERVTGWAWTMVRRELSKADSKVAGELNRLFVLAKTAQKNGEYGQAQQIYKDVIMAGQMMFDEAAEYVRRQVAFEEKLQEYNKTAKDYFTQGQYIKARKLWEKIVEDAQTRVIE